MRENEGSEYGVRTRRTRLRRSWLIPVLIVLAGTAAGGSQAMHLGYGRSLGHHARALAASGTTITAKQHEGQRSDLSWTSGNITTFKEGDFIHFRFDASASDVASGDMQVRFTGNDGTCLFFTNYFTLDKVDNISGTSPTVATVGSPAADSFGTSSGEWVQQLHLDFSAAGEAEVYYTLQLSLHAGECNGSSQHSRLQPGDGVSQTGQQNVPVPANQVIQFPTITVLKQVDRGTGTYVPASAGEYCFTLDGGASACTDANGQVVFDSTLQLSDGSHTITESQNPGYGFDHGTGTNCTFSGSTATATIAAGTSPTNATCNFFNKLLPAPTVTVTKSCPNGTANSNDRFQITDNGSNAGDPLACGGSLVVQVTPGQAYTIDETGANGADLANYTEAKSAGCSGNIINGQTASCTITNTLKAAPKVTVNKLCPNGAANSTDRFQIKNNGSNVGSALACGGSLDVQLSPGSAYSISEAAANGADLANYNSSLDSGCSGTLAHYGDVATCNVTNTLKAQPTVTVTKSCPNGPANTTDLFQITNNGSNVGSPLACGDHTDIHVGAGAAYSLDEVAAGTTNLANYTKTIGAGCSGTLAHFGDTASCTITNTLKAQPAVTVTKSCPNGPANSSDRFQITNNGSNVGDPLACGDHIDVHVAAGSAYSLDEVGAAGADLANYTKTIGAGCSGTLAHFGDTASCTITNTLKAQPTVTVTKSCPNGPANSSDRFQIKNNGSSVGDPLACGDHIDVHVGAGSAYSFDEAGAAGADLANYTKTIGAGCSGTLAHFGDTASCTITNTLKAAPTVTVNKLCPNGPANSSDRFQIENNGSNVGDPVACGGHIAVEVGAGSAYSFDEAGAAGADLANYDTSLGAGCAGTLAHFGDTATCDITNTLKAAPTVTVNKLCPNGAANTSDRFQVKNNGSDVGDPLACGDHIDVQVGAGSPYSFDEAGAVGADLANYDKTIGAGCAGTLAHFGDTATCNISNTLKAPPTVTVNKLCPNGAANPTDRFQVKNNGSDVGDPLACGDHIDVQVGAGSPYSFDEAGAAGADLANYDKTIGAGCAGTLAHYGDTATCNVTNTLKAPPTVTVTKDCPLGTAHDGDLFQITNNGDNVGDALACGDHLAVHVGAGTAYSINEAAAGTTKLSDYVETRDETCDGTLAHYGDTATCTITNTLKGAPVVTVTKSCTNGAPANASDRFEALVDGSSTDPKTILACSDTAPVTLAADTAYTITEQAGNDTTSLANYNVSYSEGCSSDSGLARGSTDTVCTITNELKAAPKVTVTKDCPNGTAGAGDRFQVKLDGNDVGDALACSGHIDVPVSAGDAYSITEGAAGTTDLANYDTTLGEGCSGTLAHYGDTAACTITNTLKPAPILIVVKNVINDNGGKARASNFTLSVTGSSPTPASFPGDAGGTVVTLLPGAYSVHEAAAAGYATTMDAGCTGTLVHYGDKATCTVTNNDIASPPPPPPPPPAPSPKIDLVITKVASPNPVNVGDNLTYTLKVTNKGPNQANNVVVTDSLPSETTFVSVSTDKGTCTGTNAIACNLGQVAVGEFITITIVVKPTTPGTITNTAVVAGSEQELNPADNTASATVTVNGPFTPPSVCYALTVRPSSLSVGHRTIVHVTVRQLGKGVAGVRVLIVGKGINKAATTNARGVATFVIKSGRPGILQIRVPAHATCRRQRIGVIGVFTPPVTG